MAKYRSVTIDNAGILSRPRGFVCDNDEDAMVWAKQLFDETPVELWCALGRLHELEVRKGGGGN